MDKDAGDIKPLVERNPKYLELVSKMIGLYSEITAKALENEQNASVRDQR